MAWYLAFHVVTLDKIGTIYLKDYIAQILIACQLLRKPLIMIYFKDYFTLNYFVYQKSLCLYP